MSLPVTVSVGPDDAVISPLATLRYQAISNSSVARWVWSLSDDTRGSISDAGPFQALQPGSVQVRACASNAPVTCGAAMVACATSTPHYCGSAQVRVQ